MRQTTPDDNKQGINATKIYQDKQRNVSGLLIITTSFLPTDSWVASK
jgi:hypothetical protein